MKQLTFYLTCLLFSLAVRAAEGPVPAPAAATTIHTARIVHQGAIRFQFDHTTSSQQHKDSVLIIFDRFDHTGAGIIFQVFAADSSNGITIPEVPAGKYYVTVQCLGMHRDRLEKTISIKAKKNEKVRMQLEAAEIFSKADVVIPAYRPKFADLSILKSK